MAEAGPRAFVCGHPVGHSRSPLIHGYWLRELQIGGSYEAIDVAPAKFAAFLTNLGSSGFSGGNITLPFKEAACELIEHPDEAARAIGAVNTVWIEKTGLHGTNTDWQGFAASMDEMAPGWDNATSAVILGAGGAARGIVYALIRRGLTKIHIINRTISRAAELAAAFPGTKADGWSGLSEKLPHAELLINTTSLGMKGNQQSTLDLAPLPPSAIVADIVYVPLETPLLSAARERGLKTVDGLGMLLHQAVPGFEKWFGVRPRVTEKLRNIIVSDLERTG